ncbi:MAG: fucose isomerase [Faecalibacterium sp.]
MKEKLNVGFITTVSGRWPREVPNKRLAAYGAWLNETLGDDYNLIAFDTLIDSPERIDEAVSTLKAKCADLVIMVYGAFTGDDVCTGIADSLRVPMILWAPREPEEQVHGSRLLSNAMVAVTMNAASMHRLGHPTVSIYGGLESEEAKAKVLATVRAHGVVKKLKGATLGLFGYRPTAFYNCAFDEGLIRRTFGIKMEETELKTVYDRMQQLDAAAVLADRSYVNETFTLQSEDLLPDEYRDNHSRLYLALGQLFDEAGYDYATIKCWPEMGNLKTTPCAVLGRLADTGKNIACEGDVDAMLAMMAQNSLTGTPGFVTDMIDLNEEENYLTFWHCGNAAPSLHHPDYNTVMGDHPLAGQGTAFYTTLKEGPVTIARFCNIHGVYKLFLLKGTARSADLYTPGSMVNVTMDTPVRSILEGMLEQGVPHHYSIVWADVADEMRAIAKLLNIEVLDI